MSKDAPSQGVAGGGCLKLHLGCGQGVVEGWINVDYAVGARFARIPLFRAFNRKYHWFNLDWDHRIFIHDLTTPFPWADGTACCVYSSHTLEHLTREEGMEFLRECHRVLCPGGLIRIVVPDLAFWISEYDAGRLPADEFVERIGVLYERSGQPFKARLMPFIQFPHKCLYDESALILAMHGAGFVVAHRKPFESDIADIHNLESLGRTEYAVIVEGRKSGGETGAA